MKTFSLMSDPHNQVTLMCYSITNTLLSGIDKVNLSADEAATLRCIQSQIGELKEALFSDIAREDTTTIQDIPEVNVILSYLKY